MKLPGGRGEKRVKGIKKDGRMRKVGVRGNENSETNRESRKRELGESAHTCPPNKPYHVFHCQLIQ